MKTILIRDVTKEECPWLDQDFKKGKIVYKYNGYTNGCISPDRTAFTEIENEIPFFQLPNDSFKLED